MSSTIRLQAPGVRFVAHRGCSGLEKENTASAFVAACNRSYFGIETDVHLTGDGQFILIHDESTARVCRDDLPVETSRYELLRSLRLPDVDGSYLRGDLILPSLAEYAAICHKYEKVSVLELKNHFEPGDTERVLQVLRDAGQLDHTLFISFDLPNLICLRGLLPEHPIQYLLHEADEQTLEVMKTYRLDLDIRHTGLSPELVRRVHAMGRLVNCWTVNTPERGQEVVDMGVDFITTNILEGSI